MKPTRARRGSLALVVLVLVAGIWWFAGGAPAPRDAPFGTRVDAAPPVRATGAIAETPSVVAPDRTGDAPPPVATPVVAAAPARPAAPAPTWSVTVELRDPSGGPVAAAEVWLAAGWRPIEELRADGTLPRAVTDAAGVATLSAPSGEFFVHVWHEHFVCTAHSLWGNGDKAVLYVPAERAAVLVCHPIHVLAYSLQPGLEVVSHGLRGSGGALTRDFAPIIASRLREVEARIKAGTGADGVMAHYLHGVPDDLGDWSVNVVWTGRTPTSVPIVPVPLASFTAPAVVGLGDSTPSSAFGTVLLDVAGEDGSLQPGVRLGLKRFHDRGEDRRLEWMECEVVAGRTKTLLAGTYQLLAKGHPFVTDMWREAGAIRVRPGEHTAHTLRLKAALRRVALDDRLPDGATSRPHVGWLQRLDTGARTLLLGSPSDLAREWLLPVAAYGYELRMGTLDDRSLELLAAGTFEVAAGADALTVPLPFTYRPIGSAGR